MSSKAASFTLKGVDKVKRNLRNIGVSLPLEIEKALRVEAEQVITVAKQNYIPVDFGDLKSSGKVEEVKRSGRDIEVSFTFGGETAPYGAAVHEYPDGNLPPSWEIAKSKGKDVKFSPSGHGPKYLERAMNDRISGMTTRIAAAVKLKV